MNEEEKKYSVKKYVKFVRIALAFLLGNSYESKYVDNSTIGVVPVCWVIL